MARDKWTVSQIKDANNRAGRFFFSKGTMHFFKDKMSYWGVWHKNGRVFLHKKRGMFAGQVREFHPDTGEIDCPMKEDEFRKLWPNNVYFERTV